MDIHDIYKEHFTTVYKYLYTISRDKSIAEELTQETFFRALKSADGFRNECSVRSWLCQIAKNAYLDHLRKNKRLVYEQELPEKRAVPEGMADRVIEKEMTRRIHRVLHDLPEPYKEVFSLHIFGELTYKEISSLFGKSESWAKMTYFRARKKIWEVLKHEDYL